MVAMIVAKRADVQINWTQQEKDALRQVEEILEDIQTRMASEEIDSLEGPDWGSDLSIDEIDKALYAVRFLSNSTKFQHFGS